MRFERARMGEDAAQGQESESQDAREFIIFSDTDSHRFELERGRESLVGAQSAYL